MCILQVDTILFLSYSTNSGNKYIILIMLSAIHTMYAFHCLYVHNYDMYKQELQVSEFCNNYKQMIMHQSSIRLTF